MNLKYICLKVGLSISISFVKSHQISMRLCTSSQPQVCPRPDMLNRKLSTNTSSSSFLIPSASDYGSWFSPKIRSSFCSWVCLRSDRVLTTNEPLQGSFENTLRPTLQGGLGTFVWSASGVPECDCCILTCPNEPHQEGKITLVRFNRTEAGVKEM